MLEFDYPELVRRVRERLNAKRGGWRAIAYDLARSEGGTQEACYRWLREFSDATFKKVEGDRLQHLARALGITIVYEADFTNGMGKRRLTGKRRV